MDALFHLIGLCPDAYTHFDILDLAILGNAEIWLALKNRFPYLYIILCKRRPR